ncbi:MAG: hypothetical protein AAF525_13500, partial [Pseudomonadota bacterium]
MKTSTTEFTEKRQKEIARFLITIGVILGTMLIGYVWEHLFNNWYMLSPALLVVAAGYAYVIASWFGIDTKRIWLMTSI